MRYIICMLIAATAGLFSVNAYADDARSVNFYIFQKANADFDFDPIVFGNTGQFITAMKGATLLLMSHSARADNGNVINLQEDLLSEQKDGKFEDVGVNCQLTFNFDGKGTDLEHRITGDCQIHGHFGDEALTLKAHIPSTDLPDTLTKPIWIELYEDKKSGIAFYANVSAARKK